MWSIALRNFSLQFHRYRVLLTALVLGGLVFSLLFGVTASLSKTVREKAARYFSGDLVAMTVDRRGVYVLPQSDRLEAAVAAAGLAVSHHHRRSLYYGADAQLFFNGASLIQRRVVGVDFSVEAESFRDLDYLEGQAPVAEGSPNGVWISDDTARRLHLKLGEPVTLLLTSSEGYRNTVSLEVAGIFADSSLFGFACYLDYRVLNRALGRDAGAVTEVGVTLVPGQSIQEAAARLQQALVNQDLPTAPFLGTKEAYDAWSKKQPKGFEAVGVLTLDGRMSQIANLIEGIQWVNWLLTLVFLLVVSIGVYNTYQMIVFERTKEIGTMRALGLQKNGVVFLFLTESLILGLVGAGGGLFLGALSLAGLGALDFSGNLLAEMFLVRGHLAWVWPLQNIVSVLVVMVLTSWLGALVPALHGSRLDPVEALRQE